MIETIFVSKSGHSTFGFYVATRSEIASSTLSLDNEIIYRHWLSTNIEDKLLIYIFTGDQLAILHNNETAKYTAC